MPPASGSDNSASHFRNRFASVEGLESIRQNSFQVAKGGLTRLAKIPDMLVRIGPLLARSRKIVTGEKYAESVHTATPV